MTSLEDSILQPFTGIDSHMDHDILDEFLDQRVYDSITNSPEPDLINDDLNDDDLNGNFTYNQHLDVDYSDFGLLKDQDANFKHQTMQPNQINDNTSSSLEGANGTINGTMNGTMNGSAAGSGSGSGSGSYNSMDDNISSNTNATNISNHNNGKLFKEYSSLNDFEYVRDEVTKLKFGNINMNPCPKTINVLDPSYLDFSPKVMNSLPYKLQLSNIPTYSRVETQIKLKFNLYPPPPELLLHIPQDLISKNKFCLSNDFNSLNDILLKNLLYLDAYVLTSDGKTSCNICSRCIKREQKRASRRKIEGENNSSINTNNSNNNNNNNSYNDDKAKSNAWANENMMKKALIFNCKEIVSFPSPSGLNDESKSLELSARIICYCRHHKESEGFKLLFVVKNNKNEVVAKQLSSPIMIMDRKKTNCNGISNTNNNKSEVSLQNSGFNSVANSSTNLQALEFNSSKRSSISVKRELDDNEGRNNNNSANHNHYNDNNSHNHFNNLTMNHVTNSMNNNDISMFSSINVTPNNSNETKMTPMSPNSIDESESQTNTDSNDINRSTKRKKLSVDDSLNISNNPMFNGSTGFSPISNSDTSVTNQFHSQTTKPQATFSPTANQQLSNLPTIQRIIPAQGPIRGGIEVTLLGFNFRPGLSVKFGANQALATHCWSETTIVTYLPPATFAGQVLVSFENHDNVMVGRNQQIFTYTDDTDRQLIELALQIVGLKMNGKLEDAKNIAKRIVGNDGSTGSPRSPNNTPVQTNQNGNYKNDWFDNAHKAVEALTKSDLATEEILISFLSLVDLPNCPIIIPNWQLCNEQGQTLLHLATIKNYSNLIKFLITHGCKIDIQDNQGLTPLFFASICGYRNLMNIFIDCKSNWNLKLSNDKYLKDYCDLNVVDVFNDLSEIEQDESQEEDFGTLVNKSGSLDSLNSMFTMNYGTHVSKMVTPTNPNIIKTNNNKPSIVYDDGSEEYADSEFESEDDHFNQSIRSEEDYEIDDDLYTEATSVTSSSTIIQNPDSQTSSRDGEDTSIWQKVKNVFGNDEEGEVDKSLPSYDDLFPFGQSFGGKPKTIIEQTLNNETQQQSMTKSSNETVEDAGVTSDSSEDMVVSYINHPRKTVENDKMLLFFWFPVLVFIVGLFFMGSMGYKFAAIESCKTFMRNTLGNVMVGNERIDMVFENNIGDQIPRVIN